MATFAIKTETEEDFFRRGRKLARAADCGEQLTESHVVSFEDPADAMPAHTMVILEYLHADDNSPAAK